MSGNSSSERATKQEYLVLINPVLSFDKLKHSHRVLENSLLVWFTLTAREASVCNGHYVDLQVLVDALEPVEA